VIEVVSGGSEQPQSSPQPSEASASQKAGAKRRSWQTREGRTRPSMQGLASSNWWFRLC
jgi:hypothetical protein